MERTFRQGRVPIDRFGRRSFLRGMCAGIGVASCFDLLGCAGSAQSLSDAYTGFIVVRLRPERFGDLMTRIDDLRTLAKEAKVAGLSSLLDNYSQSATSRLITGVPASRLVEYEKRALQSSATTSRSLTWYWRIDARKIDDQNQERLIELLRKLPEVDIAYRQPRGSDPAVDPSNDVFATQQSYLKPAPTGIDAQWAWSQPKGDGSLIAFVDVERGWILDHEDLPMMASFPDVSREMVATSRSHGTAVVGIAAGVDNTKGVVGIAPAPRWVSVSSHIRNGVADQVADAISTVSGHMDPGDVLLVEWQDPMLNPAELVPDIWDAIHNATNKGIVVIEAAGNGKHSLDGFPQIDRSNPATDSGAIIVGAAHEALDSAGKGHNRLEFPGSAPGSNFGNRVDCYAVGENLVTAGPAKTRNTPSDLTPGAPEDQAYRSDFALTSGSAPIVAGAAVLLQSMHLASKGTLLTPRQMRTALSTFGTPQGVDRSGHIGVMPDLRKAATELGLVASTAPTEPTNLRVTDR